MDERTQQQMADLVAQYNADIKRIREDIGLSAVGRYDAMLVTYTTAVEKVAKLRGSATDDRAARIRTLERKLFAGAVGSTSNPTAAISYRDAQDRAARANTPEAVEDLMDRADVTGDDDLLRACFAHAATMARRTLLADGGGKWGAVVDDYLAQNPGDAVAYDELRDLTSSRSLTDQVVTSLASTPMRPAELRRPRPAAPEVAKPSSAGARAW